MNELRSLLTLELRSLYGINRFRHTKDPRERNRYWLLTGVWMLVAAMVVFYVGGLVWGLCSLGLEELVPAYLVTVASMLILIFGIFSAGSRIFGQRGYDLLASLPVSAQSIVLSRFLTLYLEDLVFAGAVMLPGVAVYGVLVQPKPVFYAVALLGTALIPAIPLVISVLLGTAVLAISSRMKNKSLVQTVLMVALVLVILLGSFSLETVTQAQLAKLAQTVGALLEKIYLPGVWLGNAMSHGHLQGLLLFVLASVTVAALAVWLVSRNFHTIAHRLGSDSARHDYRMGTLQSRGLRKAMYLREAKRYFSSSIYVTNTIIGPILGTVLSVGICVTGLDGIQSTFPVDITGLLPFGVAAVFCTMTTTSVSISMEGKQMWTVKSLPIPVKIWLDSKILLNLSLMLPCYLVSAGALTLATRPNLVQTLWIFAVPAVMMLFSTVIGITVNLKFHSFDWEKEETVVKQSFSAMAGGFAGFLTAAAFGAAVFAVPSQYADLAKGLGCLLLVALTALLYRRNNQADMSKL